MSVSAGHGKLKEASKELLARWSEMRLHWRDENSRVFEEKYVALLASGIRTAEEALARMDAILSQLRRDCQ